MFYKDLNSIFHLTIHKLKIKLYNNFFHNLFHHISCNFIQHCLNKTLQRLPPRLSHVYTYCNVDRLTNQ